MIAYYDNYDDLCGSNDVSGMPAEREGRVFWLDTENTSYVFRISSYGHPEHLYYGARLKHQPVEALALKRTASIGSAVLYEADNPLYCLDHLCLEWSGIGRGDYRYSPAEIKMPDGSFTSDFVYSSHQIYDGCAPMEELPFARGEEAKTLEIIMTDEAAGASLSLYYTVFEETDVIARRCTLRNLRSASGHGRVASSVNITSAASQTNVGSDEHIAVTASFPNASSNKSLTTSVSHAWPDSEESSQTTAQPLIIRRLMSMMLDMPDQEYRLITFDGDWIRETHRHDRPLMPGLYVNSSVTGASSNRHNPGFLLAEAEAGEDYGTVYGFNLIYSGNHFGGVELSTHGLVRVTLGINPHCFEWVLKPGESFSTPQAVMTCSEGGFHGVSRHFHDFINSHIVPEYWQGRERPVLYNSWEAYFFKFNQRKLLHTARQAKKLGMELFVLDDGWFGKRNDDSAGLGDYQVNRKKFPRGLPAFARKIRRLGLDFGLWFEPEMVNEDSELYRRHPEWSVRTPGRRAVFGRNQLVLDLCNPAVRDYLVASVSRVLDETGASYVKWDMNRHIADAYSACLNEQGEFFHRYILGLYDILKRIFAPRPEILLETCSSGGNRFDLGMLSFGPQVWASDCTDPVERLEIQGGLSFLYPLSTFGAHVSAAPHQQTLRQTSLAARFHTACFGCLGYELDLAWLTKMERKEIREQIAFYKKHRATFQFGRFRRLPPGRTHTVRWQCTEQDQSKAVSGLFQTLAAANPDYDILKLPGLDGNRDYQVSSYPQQLSIKRLGGLVKHVLPFAVNPEGFLMRLVNRFYALPGADEKYVGDGRLLAQGIRLNNQFMGTYYTPQTRLMGDFGSNLYLVTTLPDSH